MSRSTGPIVLTRRQATALTLSLALGGLTACGGDGNDAESASTTTSGATETSSSAPITSSPGSETSSTASSSAAAESTTVTATEGEMFIELSEDSFSPGTYTIEVVNEGNMAHDLVVERDGQDVAATERIAPGQTATLTVALEAGDYVFYCSIGNHRAMGMEVPVSISA